MTKTYRLADLHKEGTDTHTHTHTRTHTHTDARTHTAARTHRWTYTRMFSKDCTAGFLCSIQELLRAGRALCDTLNMCHKETCYITEENQFEPTRALSVSLCLSVSLSLSLSLSVRVSLTVCLSLSLSGSVYIYVSLSLSLSPFLSLSLFHTNMAQKHYKEIKLYSF